MKFKFRLAILSLILIGSSRSIAQPLLEKSYEVSNKVKRGYLEGLDANELTGTIELLYNLSGTVNLTGSAVKIKYDVHTYDKDLNLLGTEKDKERIPLKRWEGYSYTTLLYTFGITQNPTFTKVQVTASYDWFWGYQRKFKVLDKVKLRDEFDARYVVTFNQGKRKEITNDDFEPGMKATEVASLVTSSMTASYQVATESATLAFAGIKTKKALTQFNKMDIIRCDKDVNVTIADSLRLPYPNNIIYSAPLTDEDPTVNDKKPRDWIVILAPMKGNKYLPADPSPTNFTYLRINTQGKIIEKFNFNSPGNAWEIAGAHEKNNGVYLFGSAVIDEPTKKYMIEDLRTEKKRVFTNIQIGKVVNGKFEFISAPALKDINASLVMPSNQKKLEYDGISLIIKNLHFSSSGDLLITGQDGKEKDYNNNYLYQFAADGTFKKCYAATLTADDKKSNEEHAKQWAIPIGDYFYPTADGKSLIWLMTSTKTVVKEGAIARLGVDFTTINLESGSITELKTTGRDKKNEFYLYQGTGPLKMGNHIFLVSETIKGDKIMLSRLDAPQ